MRIFVAFACAVMLLFLGALPGQAEKRVALVIGNSAYRGAPKLVNPANDAEAVSILLKSAGFDVVETRQNLDINDMRRAVRDFSDRTLDADIAVVFYAGHGIEVDGSNYLVPVDAKLDRDIDVDDETVSLDRVLKVIEPAKRLRLVILDACRDNPFVRMMRRTTASRAITRGLARVEPVTSDTLIAFAAKAGSTAADGGGINSPFTAALLRHLVTPGLDVRLAFGQVRDDVMKATGNRQEPFVYGSLGGAVVALASLTNVEPIPTIDPNAVAARDYEAAANLNTKAAWDAFLAAHPAGFYAALAKAQREKLDKTVYRPENNSSESTDKKQKGGGGAGGSARNARAIAYYCGSVPSYEQGIKDGTTNQLSLDTVRRSCRQARAGALTVDQFGRPFR